jgi:hypothetical protein
MRAMHDPPKCEDKKTQVEQAPLRKKQYLALLNCWLRCNNYTNGSYLKIKAGEQTLLQTVL